MTYASTSASFSGRTRAAAVFHLVMLRRGAIAHSSQGGNEVVENLVGRNKPSRPVKSPIRKNALSNNSTRFHVGHKIPLYFGRPVVMPFVRTSDIWIPARREKH